MGVSSLPRPMQAGTLPATVGATADWTEMISGIMPVMIQMIMMVMVMNMMSKMMEKMGGAV